MRLQQLSLFFENKPGHVRAACRVLADAGINIEAMSLADTEQFGILRLLVKEWERAKQVCEQHGIIVRVTDMVAALIEDRPGGLADILDAIDAAKLNIEYMYGFRCRQGQSVLVFRFDDPETAAKTMQEKGIHIIGADDLFTK